MPDCMLAKIAIGGPIPSPLVQELLQAIQDEQIHVDWDEMPVELENAKREITKLVAQGFSRATCPFRFEDAERGVRKAQEAATATPIRKASGWTCSCSARRMLTGAAMIVVEALSRGALIRAPPGLRGVP